MKDIETLAREACNDVEDVFANAQPNNDTAFEEEWFELWLYYHCSLKNHPNSATGK